MKTISSIVSGLKFIVKYGVIIGVIVKIVNFAIEEFEALDLDKTKKSTNELDK